MTIRELIIKFLETILNAFNEIIFFLDDVEGKLKAGQFLELTVNQVGVIIILLVVFFSLMSFLIEALESILESIPGSIFPKNLSHITVVKWIVSFITIVLLWMGGYVIYDSPWEKVSPKLLIRLPIFLGLLWSAYFLYRWFFLSFITKYIKPIPDDKSEEADMVARLREWQEEPLVGENEVTREAEESSRPNIVEDWLSQTDEEFLNEQFEDSPICEDCGRGIEGHRVIAVMGRKFADCISNPIYGKDQE
mgnify:CR=1 FL=1